MTKARKIVSLALYCGIAACTLPMTCAAGEEKPVQAPAQAKNDGSPDDALAKVNGIPITRGEVDRAIKVLLAQNRSAQQPTPEQMKQLNEGALDQMIAAEILYQSGLKSAPKDLDQQVENRLREGKKKFATKEEYENALKANGITEKDLKELTRKDMVIKNFVEHDLALKVTVPEKEIEKFYNENQDKFKKDETVRASHILIGVDPKANDDDKKKAKEKAESLLKKVKAGDDFAALAKANSSCPSSAQGGDLGSFGKGQMVPPFEKAAFSLKPGDVSDIVETQFGYHIIKLTEKQNAQTVKLVEAKQRIEEYLKGQKLQQAIVTFINDQKALMKIEKLAAK